MLQKYFINYINITILKLTKKLNILKIWNDNIIWLKVSNDQLFNLFYILKKSRLLKLEQLIENIGFDNISALNKRFLTISLVHSIRFYLRINIIITATKFNTIFSAISIYKSAGWLERETMENFGIWFIGHNDLRRLLTDYGFSGFPLRKDFPLTGYVECFYDTQQKNIIWTPLTFKIV